MKKLKLINIKIILIITVIVTIIFIALIVSLYSIYFTKNEAKATYDTNEPTAEFPNYPVFDDCKEDIESINIYELENDEKEQLDKNSAIIADLNVRKGYKVGRSRYKLIGIPGGNIICYDKFVLEIQDEATGNIMKGNNIIKAIYVTPENIEQVGFLIFGERMPTEEITQKYNEVINYPDCGYVEVSTAYNCHIIKPKSLPEIITDGLVTKENDEIILHKYSNDGLTQKILVYNQLKLDSNGDIKIEENIIYRVETGISI